MAHEVGQQPLDGAVRPACLGAELGGAGGAVFILDATASGIVQPTLGERNAAGNGPRRIGNVRPWCRQDELDRALFQPAVWRRRGVEGHAGGRLRLGMGGVGTGADRRRHGSSISGHLRRQKKAVYHQGGVARDGEGAARGAAGGNGDVAARRIGRCPDDFHPIAVGPGLRRQDGAREIFDSHGRQGRGCRDQHETAESSGASRPGIS